MIQFSKEYIDWPKEKLRIMLWTDKRLLFFWGPKVEDSLSDYPKYRIQDTLNSEDWETWWSIHNDMGLFVFLRRLAYFSHTGVHGSVCYITILKEAMLPYAEEEMGISTRHRPEKHQQASSILVQDQQE